MSQHYSVNNGCTCDQLQVCLNGAICDGQCDSGQNPPCMADMKKMLDFMYPVGELYQQFPGTLSPNDKWGDFSQWQLCHDFDGAFFRAEGGDALPFEAGVQGDAIRNITGGRAGGTPQEATRAFNMTSQSGVSMASGVTYKLGALEMVSYNPNALSTYTATTKDSGYAYFTFDASNVVPTAAENRPINHTMRIWKRIA